MKRRIMVAMAVLAVAAGISERAGAQSKESLFHYDRGVDLFGSEQYTTAAVEFGKAAEAFEEHGPDDGGYAIRTEYYQAMCAARTSQEGAEDMLLGFIEDYPHSIYVNDVMFELGILMEKEGEYDRAYQYLGEVDPYELLSARRDEYYYRMGSAAFRMGDTRTAYGHFRNVATDVRYTPHATYYIAYIDYLDGNLSQAKQGFNSIANEPAYEALVPFYLLQIEFMEQNYGYVIEHAPALLAKATEGRAREISRILGESYFHVKDYSHALEYINRYQSLGGEMGPEELYIAGFCNRYEGYFETAAEQLSEVATRSDELGQNAAFHLADCYMRMGDKRRALSAFALAVSADYNMAVKEEAMFNQGKLQYELGGGVFNEAITVLSAYNRMFPRSPRIGEARELLLAAYFNTRNYEAAYEAIKGIENPDNNIKTALQKICYFRGLEAFEAGDYQGAVAFFDEADANRFTAKYTALTKFWRAEVFVRQGNYRSALPLYREYVGLSPAGEYEHMAAEYNIGYCYFNEKNWKEAAVWFGRFTSDYKTHDALWADAWNRLGDVSFAGREYSQAIASYDKAIAMGAAGADYARYQRAVMQGLAGQRDRKISSLQEIINAGGGEYVDDAMYELGLTYVRQERFNDGATVLKNLVAKYPQSPYHVSALSELGLIYQNLGNDNEALRYYKQVVGDYPNSPQAKDAMLGIQNIYIDQNNVNAYFAFARESGVETNVTVVERDSLSFEAARRVYEAGNYSRALPMMDSYLAQYPRGAYRADALYALGECSLSEGNRSAALAAFREVGEMPGSKYKSPALQKAARMEAEDGDFADAARLYRELGTTATQTSFITEGLAGYLRNTVAVGDLSASNTAAQEVLSSPFVNDQLKAEANFICARYIDEQGSPDEALALYCTVNDPRTRDGAESRYRIASILFAQGRSDEAEKEIMDFAASNTQHQYWLGKSFILLGDLYVKKGDNFQAKATYQSIVDGYGDQTDGVVEEARRKIGTLN